ncbi:MAG: hypothetical protein AVDCRST_MAG04-2126, partial [uncultured Acetobacteraceae bacterium]
WPRLRRAVASSGRRRSAARRKPTASRNSPASASAPPWLARNTGASGWRARARCVCRRAPRASPRCRDTTPS